MKTSLPESAQAASRDAADRFLPDYHFEERHSLCGIASTPHDIIDAIRGFDDGVDPVLSSLLWLRELPGRLLERLQPGRGIPAVRERFGLRDFVVLEQTESEIAFGLAGQFWQIDFGLIPLRDADSFRYLARPSIAKLVLSFQVTPQDTKVCRIETVTRLLCTDAKSLRKMRGYWFLIRPFSGWIRGRILRQLKRTTELSDRSPGKA